MKDKDKLFLIYYINTSEIVKSDIPYFISQVYENLDKNFDDSVYSIVIPINNGDNHIEYINMEKADEKTINKANKLFKDYLKTLKNESK